MADRCPFCGKEPVVRCRCPLGDSRCAEGHEWHRCPAHGFVVAGPGDHARPAFECRCSFTTPAAASDIRLPAGRS